jgi:hypothetical protein
MFEKEKKQYEEDSKNYERAWELWEYKIIGRDAYTDADNHPHWLHGYHYRRKQTTFMPEYFSGLNWRDAYYLIGEIVEYTNHPDSRWHVGTLKDVSRDDVIAHFDIISDGEVNFFVYIRTCEKTFKHPTINIGGVELPKPETVAPSHGTVYWMLGFGAPVTAKDGSLYDMGVWPKDISKLEKESLKNGAIHLTEERAKAWADWWKATVIDKMK